ncbi:MAG: helix-turn-helix domain-containing protein [Chlamydiales bacterium]
MPIIVKLDLLLLKKKMRSKELALNMGITEQNLSILKTGKARALRFSTLENICKFLDCQPGDLLEYQPSAEEHPKESRTM